MGAGEDRARGRAGIVRQDAERLAIGDISLACRPWVPMTREAGGGAHVRVSGARGLAAPGTASAGDTAKAGAAAPLVLLHGFAQSSASWEGVAPGLARRLGRPAITLDLLGHGASDKPDADDPYRYGAQARLLAAVLREIAQRYGTAPIVLGYSMGGRLALGAIFLEGAPCAALLLESAGLGPVDDAEREQAARVAAGNAHRLAELGLPRFFDWWEGLPLFASQHDLPAPVRARVRTGRLANDAAALERVLRLAGQDRMPDFRPALAAAPFPILYLAGSRDPKYAALAHGTFWDGAVFDHFPVHDGVGALADGGSSSTTSALSDLGPVPKQDISRMARSGSVPKRAIVEGAGHDIHLEDPHAFIAVVTAFLQGIG